MFLNITLLYYPLFSPKITMALSSLHCRSQAISAVFSCATHFLSTPIPILQMQAVSDKLPTFIPTSMSWQMKSASVVG